MPVRTFRRPGQCLADRPEPWFTQLIEVFRSEAGLLSDLPGVAAAFFENAPALEDEAKLALQDGKASEIIRSMVAELKTTDGDLTVEEVDALPKKIAVQTGAKGKALYMPIRSVSITGKTHGPELKQSLPLLGRQAVLKRIKSFLEKLGFQYRQSYILAHVARYSLHQTHQHLNR